VSHMIDRTTGTDAIAYVGEEPWHGLGQKLTPGQPIDVWAKEAKLDWHVEKTPVWYDVPGAASLKDYAERQVLYRSDTKAPLSVVSNRFNVVQPSQILGFFDKLVKTGGFELEVAGALSGGKRVWALAKVGEGAEVVDGDLVKPYVLLGTSYDATMATIAKFTPIRVVCNNTITAAIGADGITADDVDKGYLKSVVRVLHREKFDADAVRQQLGIVTNEFERFLIKSRQLAHVEMSEQEADEFVKALLEPYYTGDKDVRESRGYQRVIQLFNGAAKGSHFAPKSRWQMLNAVTELVDHERGRSDNTRVESAWFGTGASIKTKALELLAA